MTRTPGTLGWLSIGVSTAALLTLAPASGQAQASGVLQARVTVVDVRPHPTIPEIWAENAELAATGELVLDRPEAAERFELRALPDSGSVSTRRLRLTVTHLR